MRAWNPDIVYVSMSGPGHEGPWSKVITYAPTIHALCGLTYLSNPPGRLDVGPGFSLNDHAAGLASVVAVLSALEARRRTGEGQHVDIAQMEKQYLVLLLPRTSFSLDLLVPRPPACLAPTFETGDTRSTSPRSRLASELGELARYKTDLYQGHALACLIAADRYHQLATEIRPRVQQGSVLCDRYMASSYVLQQMDGVPLPFIESLNGHADRPDLAVMLLTDAAEAAARVASARYPDRVSDRDQHEPDRSPDVPRSRLLPRRAWGAGSDDRRHPS